MVASVLARWRPWGVMASAPADLATFLPLFLLLSTVAGEARGLAPARRPGQRQRTAAVCPPASELLPCACLVRVNGVHIRCENSEQEVVMSSMEALMKRVLRVEELHLVGNRIPVLPGRIFGSIQINKLFIINNEMIAITRNAFAGLESTLEHLYISEPWLSDIPFDTLDNLANLRTCVIENTDIPEIPRLYSLSKLEFLKIDGSRVSSIPSAAFRFMPNMKKVHIANSLLNKIEGNALEGLVYLKEVNFSNNVIDWIHPRAFRTLNAVEHLSLAGNRLSGATMAILASRELKGLRILDLSMNLMTEFPKGTFVDMPTVEVINVRDNMISKIQHGAFFRIPSLRRIDLSGNLLDEFHADIFTESPNIEHLNIARNNLTFLAEMRYMARVLPNLKSLDVSSNRLQIENMRIFQGHSKLEALKLDHNEIDTLHKGLFSALPNLRELYLSNNFIQSDFDGQVWDLPELRVLDLSYNDMKKVDGLLLDGLPQVRSLDLSFNVITDVSQDAFAEAIHMKNLNMSFNSIKKLPKDVFANLTQLFELEVSFNELLGLETGLFEGLTSLEFLHLTHNQIVSIDAATFQNISKLRYLDLSANLVQDIPTQALGKLTSLEVLKLHRNAINQLHDDFFLGLKTVQHLDLSNNHIQALGQTVFRDLGVLRDLDLSVNYIQNLHPDMFSTTKQLEKLNISHNYVADLGHHTFDNVKRLRILDLTNNSLTEFGEIVKGLASLQGLFISDNYITQLKNISFMDLPSLNILRFANNGIQTFETGTFHNMNSLIILDLQENNLVELNPDSFKSMRSLEELKISRNQISIVKDFAFSDLRSLRSLELQDNVITEMGTHAFQGMPSMKFLNLSRNGFQDIPEDALARLGSLDVLDLSWNYILEVRDSSLRQLEWLTVLMLHDNDLCHLSDESFAQQRALRVLTLNNNQLRRLHLHALGNTINGLSLLDMSGNPFQCDCDLVWLQEYLLEDPTGRRGPRTTILGDSMRGVPVCAAPPKFQGLPITQVPVSAFLCDGRPADELQRVECVPRFLDPLILSTHTGGEPNPGAVNTLLQLANLTETPTEGVTAASYLDYNNPILVHDLPGLASTTITTTTTTTPATAAVSGNNPTLALSTIQQVSAASGVHTVTGDTPTIYAGSSSAAASTPTHQTTTETSLFGGFRLPTLPNLLESITNLKLPHVGLNLDWGAFPSIGRQESGVLNKFGPVGEDKPMKGPDHKQPIWIDGPASPHPLFPPPTPPVEGSTALASPPSASLHTKLGAGARPRPVTGQDEGRAQASGRPQVPLRGPGLPFRFPEGQGERLRPGVPGRVVPVRRPVNIWGERVPPAGSPRPLLPAVSHSGPGPNSGTPFLPGLSAHQLGHAGHGHPAIITNPTPTVRPPSHGPFITPSGYAPLVTVRPGTEGPQGGRVRPQGDKGRPQSKPQWSPPEVIHPNSGVSHYQPGELFLPYKPPDPNDPITVVRPPSHHTPITSPDMSPSETQVGGNNLLLRATQGAHPTSPPQQQHSRDPGTSVGLGRPLLTNPDTSQSKPDVSDLLQATQGGTHPTSSHKHQHSRDPGTSVGLGRPLLTNPDTSQSKPDVSDLLQATQGGTHPTSSHKHQHPRDPGTSAGLGGPLLTNSKTSESKPGGVSDLPDVRSSTEYPVLQHSTAPPSPTTPRHRLTTTYSRPPHIPHTPEILVMPHVTSVQPGTTSQTPPSLVDDSQEGVDQPKHSLGDLLHLLYAAEEEVQLANRQEGQVDIPNHTDVVDQLHTPSSAVSLTLPALSPTPLPTTPTTTTRQPSTTTTTEPTTVSTTTDRGSNRDNLPAGIFPPKLGEGVQVLRDVPSRGRAPSGGAPHPEGPPTSHVPPQWGDLSLSRHPMQERRPDTSTQTPTASPNTTWAPTPSRDPQRSTTWAPTPSRDPQRSTTWAPTPSRDPQRSTTWAPTPSRDPQGSTTWAPTPSRDPQGSTTWAPQGSTTWAPTPSRARQGSTTWAPTPSRARPGPLTPPRPDPTGASTPSKARPGVVLPVDKPGSKRRPTNNTYISPSRSTGRGGFPTIERVYQHGQAKPDAHTVAVQGIDLPQDAQNGMTNASVSSHDPIREAEFESSQVNAIDWYYNNYFREYSSLPVGGNKPSSTASTHTSSYCATFVYLAIIIYNHLW